MSKKCRKCQTHFGVDRLSMRAECSESRSSSGISLLWRQQLSWLEHWFVVAVLTTFLKSFATRIDKPNLSLALRFPPIRSSLSYQQKELDVDRMTQKYVENMSKIQGEYWGVETLAYIRISCQIFGTKLFRSIKHKSIRENDFGWRFSLIITFLENSCPERGNLIS